MKMKWIWAAAGIVISGVAFLLLQKKLEHRLVSFRPETEEGKNFGAFPPEIPRSEFDEIDFV